jgi:GntR family phosphonate transport system transcriptional regulator
MVAKVVERQMGVALWRQIADRIRLAISNGDYDATGMVPPETALAAEFGVNRHTVRSALAALAEEGLVRAVQGRGTMIERKDRVSYPISRRTRFSQGLGRQVRKSEPSSWGTPKCRQAAKSPLRLAFPQVPLSSS